MIDKARLEVRLGAYATAPANALDDSALLPRVQEFRRMMGGRMVATDRGDIRKRLAPGEHFVSKKVDGEFTVLVFEEAGAMTINPGGTVRVGLPVIEEARNLLATIGVKRALVAGELYVVRPDGKRARVHDVIRVSRSPGSEADLESLRFAVFDIMEIDGKPGPQSYSEAWKKITGLFGNGRLVRPVETVVVKTPEDVDERFESWVVGDGEEGIVVRSDALGLFKVKPRHSLDLAVVGFTESAEADRKGMLHDLLVALMRDDGGFHLIGRVGGGFTDDQRREFLSDLKDMVVKSDYAEVNPDHLAYEMVRPEWVIETSTLDLVSQSTRGAPIDRMVLQWNSAESRWEPLRRLPLASALAPVFVRRRDDKQVRREDINIRQVTDLVDVPLADKDARQLTLPKSGMLRREAYTKVLKGQTMVRKLLLWKTNKESEPGYPAFVLYVTDFSPNRKDPLEREVRVSDSKEQIERLWEAMKGEYIVKGWKPA